jgi:crossover junction endodeoxyribonuclease RuvC
MSLSWESIPDHRKQALASSAIVSGRSEYVTSGVIRLPAGELPARLRIIFDSVTELIGLHCPQELAMEQVFMAKSAGSALKLGQARGAAIVACAVQGMPVAEYSARQIKQSVVGTGAADKLQVQHMVRVSAQAAIDAPGGCGGRTRGRAVPRPHATQHAEYSRRYRSAPSPAALTWQQTDDRSNQGNLVHKQAP